MLNIHFVQHWFSIADPACEEALYDSVSLRRFGGTDLGDPVIAVGHHPQEARRRLVFLAKTLGLA